MSEKINPYEPGQPDTSDLNDEDLNYLIATHAIAGQILMESIDGCMVGKVNITFDHQKIGEMLNPSGGRGFVQTEAVLYKNLSPEQMAIRQLIEQGIDNPNIDLL